MADFKYIVIRAGMYEYPIIFPDKLVHEDVAASILGLEQFMKEDLAVVVSAGFMGYGGDYADKGVYVSERTSESLGIGPRPDDDSLIENFQYQHGIVTDPIDRKRLRYSAIREVPVLSNLPTPKPETPRPSKLSKARGSKARL